MIKAASVRESFPLVKHAVLDGKGGDGADGRAQIAFHFRQDVVVTSGEIVHGGQHGRASGFHDARSRFRIDDHQVARVETLDIPIAGFLIDDPSFGNQPAGPGERSGRISPPV